MQQRAVTADIGTPARLRRYVRVMLRELPFQTIGDIAPYGLELHIYPMTREDAARVGAALLGARMGIYRGANLRLLAVRRTLLSMRVILR
jgi:hypothetical protein